MLRSLSSSSVLRLNENTNVFHQKYIVALGGKKSVPAFKHLQWYKLVSLP